MILIEITAALRANDLYILCDTKEDAIIFVSQEGFRNDGYRLIEYDEYTGLDAFVLPGAPDEKIVVRSSGSDGTTTEVDHATAAAARATINALDPSDGYLAFASWQGDGGAKRLEQRPSLWRVADELGGDGIAFGREVAKRANAHGRADTDRF